MAVCGNCGANVQENAKFCPNCGAQIAAAQQNNSRQVQYEQSQYYEQPQYEQARYEQPQYAEVQEDQGDIQARIAAMNNTPDTTRKFSRKDVEQNKPMAILAYFGPLVFIPMFVSKDSRFAKYHVNQGLVLLISSIAYSIATSVITFILTLIWWRLSFVGTIFSLGSLFFFVLCVLGIINAANGRAKELPVIGRIRLLK